MENDSFEIYTLLQTDYRGKSIKAFTGIRSLVNLWGLQNTNGKKKTYIANKDGKVVRIYEGNGNRFPKILKEQDVDENLYLCSTIEEK